MPICNDIIKTHIIRFSPGNGEQAEKAEQVLRGVSGILDISSISPDRLQIRYDVQVLTYQMIEHALAEVGFVLDKSLVSAVKRSIFSYCEDALRSSLGLDQEGAGDENLSLERRDLQDPRPNDWRKYV